MEQNRRLRVCVMHADPLLSFGLILALRQEPDFELAGSAEGRPLRAGHAVDVVVVDYQTGLRLAEEARRSRDRPLRSKVVVLATTDRECEVCAALQAHEALTTRETEVLHLMAQGECNKEIARQLGIAAGTVKTHVKAIMDKLRATNRTHAVSMAVARGLVKEPRPATSSVSICASCSRFPAQVATVPASGLPLATQPPASIEP